MKTTITQQYRYACMCGCNDIVVTFSARKARLKGPGDYETVWAVRKGKRVVADTYTEADAKRVQRALAKART